MQNMKGKVIIYYGKGEGKTSAALGRAIRALGQKFKVAIFQFMKGRKTGEYKFLRKCNVKIKLCGPKFFLLRKTDFNAHRDKTKEYFEKVKKIIAKQKVDLLVLDEILYAIEFKLIRESELINLLEKRKKINIILTGRKVSKKLKNLADQISRIDKIKHYYDKKHKAKRGLDY